MNLLLAVGEVIEADHGVWSPYIQAGFAGMSFALLGVIVWLIAKLLKILQATNEVIDRNTDAITRAVEGSQRTNETIRELRDQLMRRPCMIDRDKYP